MSKKLVGDFYRCLVDPSKDDHQPQFSYLYVIDGCFIACDRYVLAKIDMRNFNFTPEDIKNAEGKAINYETTKKLSQTKWKKIVFTPDGIEFYHKSLIEPDSTCSYSFENSDGLNYVRCIDGLAGFKKYDHESIMTSDENYIDGSSILSVNAAHLYNVSTLWGGNMLLKIEVSKNNTKLLRVTPRENQKGYERDADINPFNDLCLVTPVKNP